MRANTAVLLTLSLVASSAAATQPAGGPHPLARQAAEGAPDVQDYSAQFAGALAGIAAQFPHPQARGAPPVRKLGTVDFGAKKAGMMAHRKIDKKAAAERKAKASKKPEQPAAAAAEEEEPAAEAPAAEEPAAEEPAAPEPAAPAVEAPATPEEPIVDASEAPAVVEPEAPEASATEEPAAAAAPGIPDLASLLTQAAPPAPAAEKRLTPNNFPSNPPTPDAADMPSAPFADRPAPDAPPAQQAAYYFGKLEELKDARPPMPPALPQKRAKGKKGKKNAAATAEEVDAEEPVEDEAETEAAVVDAAAPAVAAAPVVAEPAPDAADAPPYPTPEEVQAGFEGAIANLQTLAPAGSFPAGTPAGTKREALIKELRERGLRLDDGVEAAKRQVDEALAYIAKTGRSIVAGDMLGSLAGDRRIISPPISLFAGTSGPVARAAVEELQESLKKLGDELNKVALDPSNLSPAPRMYNHKVKPRATPFIG